YKRLVISIAIFNMSLLLWGCFANAAWAMWAVDRIYVAGDPTIEFFPYYPFGSWAYDYLWGQQRGHLVSGVSLTEARFYWAILAAATWAMSYFTYQKFRKLSPN